MDVQCAVCETSFTAKRSTAKYCGDACRQQAKRGSDGASNDGLVASVRCKLTDANVLDTYPAQLAIELARQMTTAGATGIASLSKELRTVMAEALNTDPPADRAEVEDEVDRARRARERKTRDAAG